jgi:sec-independent protein translocase protein TatA
MPVLEYPFIAMLSPGDIVVVLLIALVFFGGKKIPELAKGIGAGIKNFKSAIKDENATTDEKKQPQIHNAIPDWRTSLTSKAPALFSGGLHSLRLGRNLVLVRPTPFT